MSRFQSLVGKYPDHKSEMTPLSDRAYKVIDKLDKFSGECTAKELRTFMETIERTAQELCLTGVNITNLALRSMTGRAAIWSYEFSSDSPVWPTWKDFKAVLREQFDPPDAMHQNALELVHIRYEKDVFDYHKRFNSLLQVINESGKLPDAFTIEMYRAGLPLDLRNSLRRQKLQGLSLPEIQKIVQGLEDDKEDPAPADKVVKCTYCSCPHKSKDNNFSKKSKDPNSSAKSKGSKSKSSPNTTTDQKSKSKQKPRSPCLICGEMHWTRDCPQKKQSNGKSDSQKSSGN